MPRCSDRPRRPSFLSSVAVLAVPLGLTVAGCIGNADQDPGATASQQAAADAKVFGAPDAKAPAAPDAKADAKAPAAPDAKADAKADPKAGDGAVAAAANPFKKGQPARPGMSAEQLAQYAEAQGDPAKGVFTLADAFAGDDALADTSKGKLRATLQTTMGPIECELFESQTPLTVANFVGLARGVRPFLDKATDTWVKRPFFEGILFHRVIPDFMVQTGDPTGTGTGGPGYVIVDELDPSLKHNKAGILSMANRGPNTGSSQFFVTVRDTPHLDGKHAVFGQCDAKTAIAISKVKADARFNRPVEDVKIERVTITRK